MGLNKITFNVNTAGLGTPPLSKDHISGIIYYNDTLPSGFGVSDRIKTVFSLEQAEALGIIEGSTDHGVEWYHIREFFQKNPTGELWVAYYAVPSTPSSHDFEEIQTVQDAALGTIRQMGIFYQHSPFADALVTACQTKVTALQGEYKYLSVLFGGDISAVSDLSTLSDQRLLTAGNVSVCIGQDGAGKGAALYAAKSYSITDLGAKLGAVSAANVNESISWYEKFPMVTDGTEFDTVAFANGDLFTQTALSLVNAIDDKGYIFLTKEVGFENSYNNDSYSSIAITNDLATIENNRTIDKAKRNLRSFIVPKLGSPLLVNEDGTLSTDTIATFKALAEKSLNPMLSDGEVSAFEIVIDADQDVVATSTLELTAKIVPVGVAREIVINIGFVPNL